MLIRLVGHYFDNPQHIDKLISIKGLPDDWFFKKSKFGGKELIRPWVPDVEANIPDKVRHLVVEHEIDHIFPPIEKGKDSVVDKVKISGVKLDYSTNPGQEMWEKIERYMEVSTPRDQKVYKPVLCATDHKSDFNPHEAKRTQKGSLELHPSSVPDVDLRPSLIVQPIKPVEIKPVEVKPTQDKEYKCKKCGKDFDTINVFRGHNLRCRVEVKEKIGV
jgi:hypothetical protein